MAMLDILHFPDRRLRQKAAPVAIVTDAVRRLVDDMFETMYAASGIGLAAIQVNVPQRVIVVDISDDKSRPLALINPEITRRVGDEQTDEGCLSVPGVFERVQRAREITLRALNPQGEPFTMNAADLLAVCIQHEIDHLDGKLFIDYLSELKRRRIRKKLDKRKTDAPGRAA